MRCVTPLHVEAASTLAVIASSNEPLLFLSSDLTVIVGVHRSVEPFRSTRRAFMVGCFLNSAQASGPYRNSPHY